MKNYLAVLPAFTVRKSQIFFKMAKLFDIIEGQPADFQSAIDSFLAAASPVFLLKAKQHFDVAHNVMKLRAGDKVNPDHYYLSDLDMETEYYFPISLAFAFLDWLIGNAENWDFSEYMLRICINEMHHLIAAMSATNVREAYYPEMIDISQVLRKGWMPVSNKTDVPF
jgi:hypothetical protein